MLGGRGAPSFTGTILPASWFKPSASSNDANRAIASRWQHTLPEESRAPAIAQRTAALWLQQKQLLSPEALVREESALRKQAVATEVTAAREAAAATEASALKATRAEHAATAEAEAWMAAKEEDAHVAARAAAIVQRRPSHPFLEHLDASLKAAALPQTCTLEQAAGRLSAYQPRMNRYQERAAYR